MFVIELPYLDYLYLSTLLNSLDGHISRVLLPPSQSTQLEPPGFALTAAHASGVCKCVGLREFILSLIYRIPAPSCG